MDMRKVRKRFSVLALLVLLCSASVWAAALGPNNCGAGATVTSGATPWTNPGNIASSGLTATCLIPASGLSDKLEATSFGFAIPAGAIINGIQASVNRKASVASQVMDNGIFLLKTNTTPVGSDHSVGGTWPTSSTAQGYGTTADLWGTTWTSAEVNASTFGLSITAANNDVSSRTATVTAFVTITVTYTMPTLNGAVTVSGNATVKQF